MCTIRSCSFQQAAFDAVSSTCTTGTTLITLNDRVNTDSEQWEQCLCTFTRLVLHWVHPWRDFLEPSLGMSNRRDCRYGKSML